MIDMAWGVGFFNSMTSRADEMILLLVESGTNPNGCEWTCWINNATLNMAFIKAGVDFAQKDYEHPMLWWYRHNKNQPIDPLLLEVMLERGMDVDRQINGGTLLAHALVAHDIGAAERLLKAGASFTNCTDRFTIPQLIDERLDLTKPSDQVRSNTMKAWWVRLEQEVLRQTLNASTVHRDTDRHPPRARL